MKTAFLLISGFFLQTALVLAASGCGKADMAMQAASDSLSYHVLALGDSYTIGESVANIDRFPAQTTALLKSKGVTVGIPQYISKTGWTTEDLDDAIKKAVLLPKYDLVTLLIGVNDQFQGLDTVGYRKRFTGLLEKAIQLTGNKMDHVFVLSIPDYGVTPFGGGSKKISKEIDDFNAINKDITIAHQVKYIDITPISRMAANDQSLTAFDGLHPSGKQYKLWATKLAEAMSNVFR